MDKKIALRRFFFNLYLDRVDPGARRVRSTFRRYWMNRVKTREGMADVHYEGEHYEREHFWTYKGWLRRLAYIVQKKFLFAPGLFHGSCLL